MEVVKQSAALLQNAHLFAEMISVQREEEKRKKTPGCLGSGPTRDPGGTGRTTSLGQALHSSEAQQSLEVGPRGLQTQDPQQILISCLPNFKLSGIYIFQGNLAKETKCLFLVLL